jgi:tetratricopeptide (TPR) repeat protein
LKYTKIGILLILLLSTTSTQKCYGQSIDSLKLDTLISVLTLGKEDVRKVNAYLSLSDEYIAITDFTIGLTYANLAKDLSKKIKHKRGELDAILAIAHIYLAYYLDYQMAVKYYDEAFDLAKELDSKSDIIKVYRGYSMVFAFVGNYPTAILFNDQAIAMAKELDDQQLVSDLTAYGGNMYEDLGDSAKALKMYQEVEDIEKENNFSNTSNASLMIIAHYYFLEGDIDKSLKLYRSAIKRFERLQDFRWTAYAHSEIAKVYIVKDKEELAEKHALRGLEISEKYNLNKERSDNNLVLALIYKSMGDEENAKKYQDDYDFSQDSLMVDIDEREMVSYVIEEDLSSGDRSRFSGLIDALVISLIIFLLIFLSGLRQRKA